MDQTTHTDETGDEKNGESVARTLRDGDSIETLQNQIRSIAGAVEDLDELVLELLERVEALEGEPQRTNARVLDPDGSTADVDLLTGEAAPDAKERIDMAHSGGPTR